MKLSLSQSAPGLEWPDRETAEALGRIAATLGRLRSTVDVILVDDDYIQGINRNFRGLDSPTDVISFSYVEDNSDGRQVIPATENLAGEIYVSWQTLERDAKKRGLEPGNLFLRVGVHGLLHVLGYEHATEEEASRMEGEEKRLLLGYLGPSEVNALFEASGCDK